MEWACVCLPAVGECSCMLGWLDAGCLSKEQEPIDNLTQPTLDFETTKMPAFSLTYAKG